MENGLKNFESVENESIRKKKMSEKTMWEIHWVKTHIKGYKFLDVKFNGVSLKTTEVEMYQGIGTLLRLKLSVVIQDDEVKFVDDESHLEIK